MDPILAGQVAEGLRLHQRGDLAAAKGIYEEVIKLDPRNAEALQLLGVVAIQTRDFSSAVQLITRSLAVNPRQPVALSNRGTALLESGRWADALVDFDAALRLTPDYPEALSNRASALLKVGQIDEAFESCMRALHLRPAFPDALRIKARVHLQLGQPETALEIYAQLLALQPGDVEVIVSRADVLLKLRQYDSAIIAYNQALQIRPADASAWSNRGAALRELKDLAAAVASFERAIELKPDYAEAWSNRGAALRELKRLPESIASLERALALRPDFAEAHYNAGISQLELERPADAEASFDRALQLKPDNHEALYNRGIALMERMQLAAALASFDRALELQPGFAPAIWNKALVLLVTGDFARGWPLYESRWKNHKLGLKPRDLPVPQWDGTQSLTGRVILLHAEQGLGDTLQFCRYARLVAERGAEVLLEVPPELRGVLDGLAGVSRILARGEPLPPFDLHSPLLSLPGAFQTGAASIPAPRQYLTVPAGKRTQWSKVLGPKTRPRAGLVWSGSAQHLGDKRRSLALSQLLAHLPPGFEYVSLQKEVREADAIVLREHGEIRSLRGQLVDFTDTAAVIELMDVVISVDTSVAHLSAALGLPTWTLLSFSPDWRWLLEREDTPWYPTMKLYRQAAAGNWEIPLARIREDLRKLVPGAVR